MNRLTIAMFKTTDAQDGLCRAAYIAGANTMLAKYGIALELYPTDPSGDPRVLPYTGAVFDTTGDPGDVRAMAHRAVPNGRGIPVIFCKRNTDTATSKQVELGSTIQTANPANNGIGWMPYILINTQDKSPANEVLLHEMIHAAWGANQPNPGHDPHDTDPSSAFYAYGTTGTNPGPRSGSPIRQLPTIHADMLRKAYFSVFVP
jgi:hypothetical protein